MKDFLPISREDMHKRGWDAVDFAFVIGDAYVDHPSFGPAIISRVLEAAGKQHQCFRGAEIGLSGLCRQYGFDGESLQRIEKAPQ